MAARGRDSTPVGSGDCTSATWPVRHWLGGICNGLGTPGLGCGCDATNQDGYGTNVNPMGQVAESRHARHDATWTRRRR